MLKVTIINAWETPVDYNTSMADMASLHERVVSCDTESSIIITRHNPVVTHGLLDQGQSNNPQKNNSNNLGSNNLGSNNLGQNQSYEYVFTNRGGGITYHDSGQIVFYPILRLKDFNISLNEYTRFLLDWMCKSIESLGYKIKTYPDQIGIWVNENNINKKVGFIGVRIKNKVSMHGFSINLDASLDQFSHFAPCGVENLIIGNLKIDHITMIDALLRNFPIE